MSTKDDLVQKNTGRDVGRWNARLHGLTEGSPLTARVGDFSLIFVWIVLIVGFGALRPDTFLTATTMRSVAADQAITAMMALALVLPLAAGVFDLAVGATMGLSVLLVAWFQATHGVAWPLAVLISLAVGALVGSINAFVVIKLGVDSFIATLGMSAILVSVLYWVSGGQQVVSGISTQFTDLGSTKFLSIPLPFYYMCVLAIVLWYAMARRPIGRFLYATGANHSAARLAGVQTERLQTFALIASGTLSALAGVVFTARIGSASLDAGSNYLLPAFAAVFLGATQFRSRLVNVPGTVLAVYVLATGVKGLQLMGSPYWVSGIFNGCALIVAVALAGRGSAKA